MVSTNYDSGISKVITHALCKVGIKGLIDI